jgi:Predicted membrane protein
MVTTSLTIATAVLVVLNVISFSMFVSDKKRAVKGSRRTSERTLLIVALFGPFGAAIGMNLSRHKTRKLKFKLVYLFLVLHLVLIVFLLWRYCPNILGL